MPARAHAFALSTIALLAGAALAAGGCVEESVCSSDRDCPYPHRCSADGECYLECSATQPESCPEDRPLCLVSEHRCVECLDDHDCEGEDACVDHACQPLLAPDFTLFDENPISPTFGEAYTLSRQTGSVVVLFFATLGCPICRGQVEALDDIAADARAEGLADLVVLLINEPAAADYVASLEGYELPILQDTDASGVFDLYGAFVYDMLIVDRGGFLVYSVVRHPEAERDEALEEILAYL